MKALRYLAVVTTFPLLVAAGCGGGGGDDSVSSQPNTYGDTNLPGHLLVAAVSGPASLYDLRTGEGSTLATSPFGGNMWSASTNPDLALRTSSNGNGTRNVEVIRTSDWTRLGEPVVINGSFHSPKISPDGKYILTFWAPALTGHHVLTIFNVATGQVVKSGSLLDAQIVNASPAGWLPDGRYVYLAGNKLYSSSLSTQTEQFVATLSLPFNDAFDNDWLSGFTNLMVSPDGTKIAFTWSERRTPGGTKDGHIFVANTDGTGLHRLTAPPDSATALTFGFGSAAWSPDSKWVAGVLYMDGSVITPSFPPDAAFGGVVGTTGCGTNPAFVLPADAVKVPISWPRYDAQYSIKVKNGSGTGGKWVSTCESVQWVR